MLLVIAPYLYSYHPNSKIEEEVHCMRGLPFEEMVLPEQSVALRGSKKRQRRSHGPVFH
jgi:hypothetical protein